MNILIDQVINCLHWLDMYFPNDLFFAPRKDRIDWKEVGMMRTRLVHMRFATQGAGAALHPVLVDVGVKETTKVQTAGSMLASFRTMNGKSQDLRAIKHWYSNEESIRKEKDLADRIESGKRAHEARQTSGSYVAVTAEEAASVYEIQYEPMTQASEAKIKEFLTGTADDINDLLFTNFNSVTEIEKPVPLAAKFPLLTRFSAKPSAPASKAISEEPSNNNISQDSDTIAALEIAVKLDMIAQPTELQPISLPVDVYIAEEQDTKTADCANMDAARRRKATKSSSKKSRRRK